VLVKLGDINDDSVFWTQGLNVCRTPERVKRSGNYSFLFSACGEGLMAGTVNSNTYLVSLKSPNHHAGRQ
jgi:hypothetical protein